MNQKVKSCDSCNFAEKTNSLTYPVKCTISKPIPMMVHEYCVNWFAYVGCASHSDFQSEREKVLELLDDLRRYANGEYKEADLSDNEHDLRIHLEYENRIWGIMKELRQAGE
jgi:hypothetical protein